MNEHHPEIIIVKRRSAHEEEHHGGAWKIAFADFMTAMMTFFLVLWIINATDKSTKSVIARYFNPVRLENPAKAQKGVHNEVSVVETSKGADPGSAASPEKAKAAPSEKGQAAKAQGEKPGGAQEPRDSAHPKPTLPESALLADPYGSLDRIAGPPPADTASRDKGEDAPVWDPAENDAIQDPFESRRNPPREAQAAERDGARPASGQAALAPPAKTVEEPAAKAAHPVAPAVPAPALSAPSSAQAQKTTEKERQPSSAAAQILRELQAKIGGANHGPGPSIDVRATSEGVLISLTDQLNFSMFPVGSAEPQPQVVRAMGAIAQSLASHPGVIVIRGHTDGRPYRSQTYDNWRLSEARAQMAYYMLTRASLSDKRVEHVEGYADRRLKNAASPYAAENRRIEILLRGAEQ